MNIVFATSGLDFNGDTVAKSSLGGSETAVACMSRELARRGHKVDVFCKCSQPGVYEGVTYTHLDKFHSQARNMAIDVQVISRFGSLWKSDINGAIDMWWLHDMPGRKEETMMYAIRADIIALLSDFHVQSYKDSGAPIDRVVWKTANGVDMDLIKRVRAADPAHPARFIYSSLPERGLDGLLTEVWPKIHAAIPGSELVVAGYDLTSINDMLPEEVKKAKAASFRRAENTPGVRLLGPLSKPHLYSLMKSCIGMLYPTAFPEIFCITAVEAQACGLPIITSNAFALKETVGPKSGVLVMPDKSFGDNFVKAAISLYEQPEWRQQLSDAGPKFVQDRGYTWSRLAEMWEAKFESIFRDRRMNQTSRIISTMVRGCDIAQAEFTEKYVDSCEEPFAGQKLLATEPPLPRMLVGADYDVLRHMVTGVWQHHTELAGKLLLDITESHMLSELAETDGVKVVFADEPHELPADGYDAIFLGDGLATSYAPHDVLEQYRKKLKPGGYVLSATPVGPIKMGDRKQLWSFSSDDLRSLASELQSFAATFAHMFTGLRGKREGYWVACFSKEGKTTKINLRERMNRFRPDRTLSACIIAKEEEKWINMCLSEIKDIADQIVLVDCKSQDDTAELARRKGAEVHYIDFEDFSQARNISLDHALGDWVLWIDCDERLVNAERLCKFLQYELAEAYTIRQNHLLIDDKKGVDTPARLVRNRPYYRFVGKIHEHCEDVSDPSVFSKAIAPCFEAGDCDIAHYGYVHEKHRRKKAILRNMDLLIEDARVNLPKGRMLTWALAMRDYLNAVKWHFRHVGGVSISPGDFEHRLLNAVIDTYHAIFGGNANPQFESLVYPFYQEACGCLAANGLQYSGTKLVPFQTAVMMTGDHKPLTQKELSALRPQTIWFVHPDEMRQTMEWNQGQFCAKMFNHYRRSEDDFKWVFKPEAPDPVQVLGEIRELYKRG